MEKELLNSDKELLLKDLCARLPYGVKIDVTYSKYSGSSLRARLCSKGINLLDTYILGVFQQSEIYIKPYLFPLSSMTEGQKEELNKLTYGSVSVSKDYFYDLCNCSKISTNDVINIVDWINKNHFDYRGLIEKGLAINATGLNIY